MSSKRFKKLPKNTNTLKAEPINNLLAKVKENCTTKFDESLDLNILINNKQKKNEINLRSKYRSYTFNSIFRSLH